MVGTPLAKEGAVGALPAPTIRLLQSLRHFAVEVPRTARRFLSTLPMPCPIEQLGILQLDKGSTVADTRPVLAWLREGHSVAMLSEVGLPGIADPGALLAYECQRAGISVIPHVGPSSIFLTLIASGLNGQSFAFNGYLPIKQPQRREAILRLERRALQEGQSQLFIETPYRNDALIEELLKTLKPNTLLALGVNLQDGDGYVRTRPVSRWREGGLRIGKVPALFALGCSNG